MRRLRQRAGRSARRRAAAGRRRTRCFAMRFVSALAASSEASAAHGGARPPGHGEHAGEGPPQHAAIGEPGESRPEPVDERVGVPAVHRAAGRGIRPPHPPRQDPACVARATRTLVRGHRRQRRPVPNRAGGCTRLRAARAPSPGSPRACGRSRRASRTTCSRCVFTVASPMKSARAISGFDRPVGDEAAAPRARAARARAGRGCRVRRAPGRRASRRSTARAPSRRPRRRGCPRGSPPAAPPSAGSRSRPPRSRRGCGRRSRTS